MSAHLRRLSGYVDVEHSHSFRALWLPPQTDLAHRRWFSLERLQAVTESCLLEIHTEPRNQVPFAILIEVATTGRLHVGEGDRLEHGNTTSMMSHVLDVDSIQVLAHGRETS